MKFCPVVPEICRGQVHVPKKERRKRKRRIIIHVIHVIIIISNLKMCIDILIKTTKTNTKKQQQEISTLSHTNPTYYLWEVLTT
jgi:ABC-type Na+ efflux pump permease subunit